VLKTDLTQILKDINLSKKEFANLSNISYNTVNNWNDESKPVPPWVQSWLENYTKLESYKKIRHEVFKIENVYELALDKIFNEIDENYKEQAVYIYKSTYSVDKTIKMVKIASSISGDAEHLQNCTDIDIDAAYEYLNAKDFKPSKEDESRIVDLMNKKGWK